MNIFRKQKFLLILILCDIISIYYSLLLKFDLEVAILIIILGQATWRVFFLYKNKGDKNEQKNKERNG